MADVYLYGQHLSSYIVPGCPQHGYGQKQRENGTVVSLLGSTTPVHS